MSTGNIPALVPPDLRKVWLYLLRVLVAASVVEFVVYLIYAPGLLILLVCALAYLAIFVALLLGKQSFAVRAARALSVFLFPASTVYLLVFLLDPSVQDAAPSIWLFLTAATQLGVVICATQLASLDAKGQTPRSHVLAERIFAGVVILGVFIFISRLVFSGGVGNQSGVRADIWASDSLARIFNCVQVYFDDNPGEGYPATLEPLGPDDMGCVQDEIVNPGDSDSYTFTYTPGPPDAQGLVNTFTVTARATGAVPDTPRNFFINHLGVIRYTLEDRDATIDDIAF